MSIETPTNDMADQLRPARPDIDDLLDEDPLDDTVSPTTEADPADVAEQHRIVPLPDDPYEP